MNLVISIALKYGVTPSIYFKHVKVLFCHLLIIIIKLMEEHAAPKLSVRNLKDISELKVRNSKDISLDKIILQHPHQNCG